MVLNETEREKLNKFFKDNNSVTDEPAIRELFCDDNRSIDLKSFLSKQFDKILAENGENRKDLDHILYKLHYDINSESRPTSNKIQSLLNWTLRIASILILPLAIFWGVKSYLNNNTARETWVEINSPAWTRIQFSLPDGTTGWLNSNSKISYNGSFVTNRKVLLRGEAYFDVKKDKIRPFRVNASNVEVKVLGTRFNIASYENEKNIEIVLDEGRLEVRDTAVGDPHIMKPNDLVKYDKVVKSITTEIVEPKKYLSWTEGKLVFRNDPLDVIARRLERWYNIDVELDSNFSQDLRLRATFEDENLEDVLYFLKRSLPIQYTIEKVQIGTNNIHSKQKVIISSKI